MIRALLVLLLLPALGHAKPKLKVFSEIQHPTGGKSEALGSYALGCLAGGVEVPRRAPGFATIRRERHRFFTHSATKAWLLAYGKRLKALGLSVKVGDLSQPRGGLMSKNHRSHQNGLDVDVWFNQPAKRDASKDANFPSLVDDKTETIDRKVFAERHVTLLREAARSPEVARIFVNWVVKAELCTRLGEGDRDWLGKIRPWHGHDRHFHVRLACPQGSATCVNQTLPPGDGCGEEAWFARDPARRPTPPPKPDKKDSDGKKKKPKARAKLPKRCKGILAAPDVAPPAPKVKALKTPKAAKLRAPRIPKPPKATKPLKER